MKTSGVINALYSMEKTAKSIVPIFNSPEDFNDRLNTFDYGIIHRGKNIVDPSDEEFEKKYKTIKPANFFKHKIGVCWDYTSAEKSVFDNNFKDVEWAKTYYIELSDKISSTHTFLVYKKDGKFHYFESSYQKHQGIHEFGSLTAVFDFVLRNMFKDVGGKNDFEIYEYDVNNTFNMKTLQFMNHVINTGKKIEHKYKGV